jgi:AcrR family transcriptional regulator
MKKRIAEQTADQERENTKPRQMRADGQRKMSSILGAAMGVFAKSGVDAPVREIAERAGVGLGTIYRHFPRRSDLIVAVFRTQMDACADAAPDLASKYEPLSLPSEGWQPRCTRATQPIALCLDTSTNACGQRLKHCWKRLLQRE